MTQRTWDGSTGAFSSASDWSPAGVPASGNVAIISSGTVTLGANDLAANLDLEFAETETATPTLILRNTIVPASDTVYLGLGDGVGSGLTMVSGAVQSSGMVASFGRLSLSRATLSISGTFTNAGDMILQPYAAIGLTGASDQFVNNASLSTYRHAQFPISSYRPPAQLVIGVPIAGTGTINLLDGFNLEFASNVGAGQTIVLGGGIAGLSQANNVLTIDDATIFKAQIASYGAYKPIVATGPTYDSVQVTRTNGITSLDFLRGGTIVDALTFVGRYSMAQFTLSPTMTLDGREQTTISTDGPAAGPAGSLGVSRFFNNTNGTQFLTASASEAMIVFTTRSDFVYEGGAFRAVNPADNDPAAAPVYRFFDTVEGTHFFTANTGERNSLVATRPDLVYEPNSTFYEHTAAQTGDVPVYRFFESTNGTHFYTASVPEQASILARRPDLIAEGIAFYAPTG